TCSAPCSGTAGSTEVAWSHPTAEEEWLDHRVESWVETYKKSMLTPIVLPLIPDHQPIGMPALPEAQRAATRRNGTARGLYRTRKRLEDSQLLATSQVDAPRAGAKRKELSLTDLGVAFLAGIRANLVEVPEDG